MLFCTCSTRCHKMTFLCAMQLRFLCGVCQPLWHLSKLVPACILTRNSDLAQHWPTYLQVASCGPSSGQHTDAQTIIGTTVSGRDVDGIDGIENSVGLFINTLPLSQLRTR
mmetsp:Transcript_8777/g.14221  ORF Transcript_8777/g.14221 Transcript_8777/m.14221 type:complete len:111 (+) Transcript_8777:2103-2435(+)